MASGSAWPSTRRAARLAYRAACRHARRSTAKPRDAVRAPHGHVGPPPPTGVARGRARPCTRLCRRLTRLTPSLHSESLPSAAIRRPKCLFCRFSSVASRVSELAGLLSAVASRCKRRCRPFLGSIPPQHNAISPISLTAITYFPDKFPISHNLLRNSQLSHPRRTRLAESGEFQQSRINFCEFKELHSSRNSSQTYRNLRDFFPKLLRTHLNSYCSDLIGFVKMTENLPELGTFEEL